MSDHKLITDEELDLYLDGLMSESEQAALEERLAGDVRAEKIIHEHRALESKLRATFVVTPPSVADVERLVSVEDETAKDPPRKAPHRRSVLLLVGTVAATVTWLVVFFQWNRVPAKIEPFFEQRPLAALYLETVEQGFRPYYFCEDQARFALTFQTRQDVPLRLLDTPEDRRMLGLSYLGGLSRDTTAILCYVDDRPVMVFVDRQATDDQPVATLTVNSGIHVHRAELGDLVLYEVTPFAQPRMTEYLKVAE